MKIVFSGPDGSGKSSIVAALSRELDEGQLVHISWRRFGFVLARAFNLFGRMLGFSYYEQTPIGPLGYHNYKAPWSYIYICFAWFDCMVFILPKWWVVDRFKTQYVTIIDRFLFDIVADLILSTKQTRFVLWMFHASLKSHQARHVCVFLICSQKVVEERRPDIVWDKSYSEKVRIYTLLRRLYSVHGVHTDRMPPNETARRVLKLCV
ncbi:hypothetical protein SAMN05421764_12411 [Donghicola eburneus]|nr:hypothetical protein SAMN05421764_12411 [Donghicola eburneus]